MFLVCYRVNHLLLYCIIAVQCISLFDLNAKGVWSESRYKCISNSGFLSLKHHTAQCPSSNPKWHKTSIRPKTKNRTAFHTHRKHTPTIIIFHYDTKCLLAPYAIHLSSGVANIQSLMFSLCQLINLMPSSPNAPSIYRIYHRMWVNILLWTWYVMQYQQILARILMSKRTATCMH